MSDQIRVDSSGEPQVDFVWGGMAPQPDAARKVDLDPKLGDNPALKAGYSGFPGFTTQEVDNAPGVQDDGIAVVEPGKTRAVKEAGTLKVNGLGVNKPASAVQGYAADQRTRQLASIASQHGLDIVPAPLQGVEQPDTTVKGTTIQGENSTPAPIADNTLAPEQQKAKEAAEKEANSPVNKTVVMTPEEAIKAREADGRVPQEPDLNEPIPPVTPQDKVGQEKVGANHSPDSEPALKVAQPEVTAPVPSDQNPDAVEGAETKIVEGAPTEQNVPTVETGKDAKAPTPSKVGEVPATAGDPAVVDPATQLKDPAKNLPETPAAPAQADPAQNPPAQPLDAPAQPVEEPHGR